MNLIFLKKKALLDVIELDYCHKCRDPPFEAAIYSLEAKGEVFEKFRADVTAELTVELEEQDKTERSSLALPVDFTKEDVARVIGAMAAGYSCLKVFCLEKYVLSHNSNLDDTRLWLNEIENYFLSQPSTTDNLNAKSKTDSPDPVRVSYI